MKKLVNEGISRKIDAAGRISIPKHLRTKYKFEAGDDVDIYTREFEDGRVFVGFIAEKK